MASDDEQAASEHVLEWVRENTEPEPSQEQSSRGHVWAGATNLKAQARKDRIPFDVDDLEGALAELRESGEIVTWHGLVAPATDEHLEAIIETEAQANITRSLLVAKCNRLRSAENGVSA